MGGGGQRTDPPRSVKGLCALFSFLGSRSSRNTVSRVRQTSSPTARPQAATAARKTDGDLHCLRASVLQLLAISCPWTHWDGGLGALSSRRKRLQRGCWECDTAEVAPLGVTATYKSGGERENRPPA